MPEDEWVDVSEAPLIADVAWLDERRNGRATPEPSSWEPLNLAELEEQPPVEPTLGGLGFVYPGKRHVFSGPQESAKTLVAYIVALEVIRRGGSIVLVDFEMGRYDTRNRLRELGATPEELGRVAFVEPQEPITKAASEALMALAPELVLIDASAGAFVLEQLDDNKRGDVERFAQRYVDPFRRAQIATILIDHVTKNVETRGNYAIGSERKVGQTDVHLGFTVIHPIKRGERGSYKVTTHKDRVGYLKRGKLGDFELVSDQNHSITWTFKPAVETDEEHPFRPTGLMEKVSRFLEMQQGAVSLNTIRTAKLGKHEYVELALGTLTSEGFIEESAGANRARLFESLEAYREDSDSTPTGSPQVRPEFAPEPGIPSSPVRPTPFRGGEGDPVRPDGRTKFAPEPLPDPNDDIPF